jgi:REP element-mobilizing transposase RayT
MEIGGHVDHVHVLTRIRTRHRVSDVVCEIKSGSSRWVHDILGIDSFEWQKGYGAFSASAREVGELRTYIRGQKAHHKVKTFLEEYIEFLDESGIDWDPKYLT